MVYSTHQELSFYIAYTLIISKVSTTVPSNINLFFLDPPKMDSKPRPSSPIRPPSLPDAGISQATSVVGDDNSTKHADFGDAKNNNVLPNADSEKPTNTDTATATTSADPNTYNPADYPSGVVLAAIIAALMMSIFLIALDMSIVATAIPKITDEFKGLDKVSWYGSAFFMTVAAFQSTCESWAFLFLFFFFVFLLAWQLSWCLFFERLLLPSNNQAAGPTLFRKHGHSV